MKVAMAIAIMAAGLFSILGILFIIFFFKHMRNAKKNEEDNEARIERIENSLGNMGRLISEQTDILAAKLEENKIKPEPAPQPKPQPVEEETSQSVEAPIQQPTVKENPEAKKSAEELDEINIDDLFDDFEDLLEDDFEDLTKEDLEDILAEDVIEDEIVSKPPKKHMAYDVGKSGKKYTASELENLIRA